MAERKLSVETPYGVVTRRTARQYQYVVVSFGRSEAYLRERHVAGAAMEAARAADYRQRAAAGNDPRWDAETLTRWANRAQAAADEPFSMETPALVVHGWSLTASGAAKMVRDAERLGYLGLLVQPVENLVLGGAPVLVTGRRTET